MSFFGDFDLDDESSDFLSEATRYRTDSMEEFFIPPPEVEIPKETVPSTPKREKSRPTKKIKPAKQKIPSQKEEYTSKVIVRRNHSLNDTFTHLMTLLQGYFMTYVYSPASNRLTKVKGLQRQIGRCNNAVKHWIRPVHPDYREIDRAKALLTSVKKSMIDENKAAERDQKRIQFIDGPRWLPSIPQYGYMSPIGFEGYADNPNRDYCLARTQVKRSLTQYTPDPNLNPTELKNFITVDAFREAGSYWIRANEIIMSHPEVYSEDFMYEFRIGLTNMFGKDILDREVLQEWYHQVAMAEDCLVVHSARPIRLHREVVGFTEEGATMIPRDRVFGTVAQEPTLMEADSRPQLEVKRKIKPGLKSNVLKLDCPSHLDENLIGPNRAPNIPMYLATRTIVKNPIPLLIRPDEIGHGNLTRAWNRRYNAFSPPLFHEMSIDEIMDNVLLGILDDRIPTGIETDYPTYNQRRIRFPSIKVDFDGGLNPMPAVVMKPTGVKFPTNDNYEIVSIDEALRPQPPNQIGAIALTRVFIHRLLTCILHCLVDYCLSYDISSATGELQSTAFVVTSVFTYEDLVWDRNTKDIHIKTNSSRTLLSKPRIPEYSISKEATRAKWRSLHRQIVTAFKRGQVKLNPKDQKEMMNQVRIIKGHFDQLVLLTPVVLPMASAIMDYIVNSMLTPISTQSVYSYCGEDLNPDERTFDVDQAKVVLNELVLEFHPQYLRRNQMSGEKELLMNMFNRDPRTYDTFFRQLQDSACKRGENRLHCATIPTITNCFWKSMHYIAVKLWDPSITPTKDSIQKRHERFNKAKKKILALRNHPDTPIPLSEMEASILTSGKIPFSDVLQAIRVFFKISPAKNLKATSKRPRQAIITIHTVNLNAHKKENIYRKDIFSFGDKANKEKLYFDLLLSPSHIVPIVKYEKDKKTYKEEDPLGTREIYRFRQINTPDKPTPDRKFPLTIAYDIETFCKEEGLSGEVIPYAVGYMVIPTRPDRGEWGDAYDIAMDDYYNLLHEKQPSIYSGVGICFDNFVESLWKLKKAKNDKCLLIAHNGSKFDHYFLFSWALKRRNDSTNTFNVIIKPRSVIVRNGRILTATIVLRQGSRTMELICRDTMLYWPGSLTKLGHVFDCPTSKGDLAYEEIGSYQDYEKNRENIDKYLVKDVKLLAEVIVKMENKFFDIVGFSIWGSLTIASVTRKLFFSKKYYPVNCIWSPPLALDVQVRPSYRGGRCEVYQLGEFRTNDFGKTIDLLLKQDIATTEMWAYKIIHDQDIPEPKEQVPEWLKAERKQFHENILDWNEEHKQINYCKALWDVDQISQYPYAMTKDMPVGKGVLIKSGLLDEDEVYELDISLAEDRKTALLKIRFDQVPHPGDEEGRRFPPQVPTEREDGRLVFQFGPWSGYLPLPNVIWMLQSQYIHLENLVVEEYWEFDSRPVLKSYIEEMFESKQKIDDELESSINMSDSDIKERTSRREVIKILLNSLYGFWGLRVTGSKNIRVNQTTNLDAVDEISNTCFVKRFCVFAEKQIVFETDSVISTMKRNVIIALWITAEARKMWYQVLIAAHNNPNYRVLGGDTDSLKIADMTGDFYENVILQHEIRSRKGLGGWSDEMFDKRDGRLYRMISLSIAGLKMYSSLSVSEFDRTGGKAKDMKLRAITKMKGWNRNWVFEKKKTRFDNEIVFKDNFSEEFRNKRGIKGETLTYNDVRRLATGVCPRITAHFWNFRGSTEVFTMKKNFRRLRTHKTFTCQATKGELQTDRTIIPFNMFN